MNEKEKSTIKNVGQTDCFQRFIESAYDESNTVIYAAVGFTPGDDKDYSDIWVEIAPSMAKMDDPHFSAMCEQIAVRFQMLADRYSQ